MEILYVEYLNLAHSIQVMVELYPRSKHVLSTTKNNNYDVLFTLGNETEKMAAYVLHILFTLDRNSDPAIFKLHTSCVLQSITFEASDRSRSR